MDPTQPNPGFSLGYLVQYGIMDPHFPSHSLLITAAGSGPVLDMIRGNLLMLPLEEFLQYGRVPSQGRGTEVHPMLPPLEYSRPLTQLVHLSLVEREINSL